MKHTKEKAVVKGKITSGMQIDFDKDAILKSGNTEAIAMLPLIKSKVSMYNRGLAPITAEIADGYDLVMLMHDFGLSFKNKPVRQEPAVIYKSIHTKEESYLVIKPNGDVWSINMPRFTLLGNVCEMLFSYELRHKYIKQDGTYIQHWVNQGKTLYKSRIRINGYRPKLPSRLPSDVKNVLFNITN